jgi:hypothetical protein
MSFAKISWNMNNVCNSKKKSGNFSIIRGIREHIDYQKCPPERYQPKLVMSNDYYQCQFRKSGCSEEGQVKYNMAETTTNDTKCRCDYTRSYAFVEKPRNTCYCIPSEEDCSCYLNKCHKEQKLDTGNYIYTVNLPDSMLK